jgi:hypothetical protein
MRALQRMRLAVNEQRYRISSHANEEMSKDELLSVDIENIILTGKIVRRYTHDPRGARYEVIGNTTDARQGCVVCCFLPNGVLLIITS